jgi:predicted DNA-binding protein YlxM (UPF0122 family)
LSIKRAKGKAVTRTFRIDETWDTALAEIAEEKNLSLSAMLEKITKDYVLFYQWVEDLSSLVFSPNTITELLEELSEEQLRKTAEHVAQSTFKESYLARGDELQLETVVFQIRDQMARYANWFEVVEHKTDMHYFYIKHQYGEKWSCFVETYLLTLFTQVAGVNVTSERVGENILIKLIGPPEK